MQCEAAPSSFQRPDVWSTILMRFSITVPRVTVQRRMNLGPLVSARMALRTRPSWTVIFLKGYALLCEATPELRRAYVKLPWPQLYEYPLSVASIAHERDYEGERAVMLTRIRARSTAPSRSLSLRSARRERVRSWR